ncbi:hypothetical protein GX51_06282 [Blastomyces parvus]|uniref:Extracellular membrane protein CFEM domain-containing protein n=1 Tax=Blastomyces parvus TaxID=2060905 RepID=A0A2B7WSF5_9EURO|nr:hypothetical protein GX51_06282 [Blastomyces parvus]
MKKITVALLALISVVAACPTDENPPAGTAGWDYCAWDVYCNTNNDCKKDPSCLNMAINRNPEYIACGPNIFESHTCWAWTVSLFQTPLPMSSDPLAAKAV